MAPKSPNREASLRNQDQIWPGVWVVGIYIGLVMEKNAFHPFDQVKVDHREGPIHSRDFATVTLHTTPVDILFPAVSGRASQGSNIHSPPKKDHESQSCSMLYIYLDPQGVVDGHPLTSKGLLMDTLSVVLVCFN